MNDLISIIIPVYNSNKKLHATVQSLISQNVSMEILLIDDGSIDPKSLKLYHQLSSNYKVVSYFRKENEGIVRTRLYGISKSKGKYISFADHDDTYTKYGLKKLYETMERDDSDIVVGNGYEKIFPFLPSKKNKWLKKEETLRRAEFLPHKYLTFFGLNQFPVATWGKIYKSSLLKSIDFKILDYSFMDDIVLNSQIFFHARQVSFVPDYVYTHFAGGFSSTVDLKIVLDAYSKMYLLRSELLDKCGNAKGKQYLYYEIKNIIRGTAIKFFQQEKYSKFQYFEFLHNFSNTEAFKETNRFFQKSEIVINLLYNNEFESLLEIGLLENKKNKSTILLKNILRELY